MASAPHPTRARFCLFVCLFAWRRARASFACLSACLFVCLFAYLLCSPACLFVCLLAAWSVGAHTPPSVSTRRGSAATIGSLWQCTIRMPMFASASACQRTAHSAQARLSRQVCLQWASVAQTNGPLAAARVVAAVAAAAAAAERQRQRQRQRFGPVGRSRCRCVGSGRRAAAAGADRRRRAACCLPHVAWPLHGV